MKFIRDIIAEKTNMANAEAHREPKGVILDSTLGDDASALTEGIDPVHMVASGATSLSRESNFAYRAENDSENLSNRDDCSRQAKTPGFFNGSIDEAAGFGDDEDFDLLSDPEDGEEIANDLLTSPNGHQESAELFADIWVDNNDTADDSEEEFFTSDVTETDVDEPVDAVPAQDVPQTNAEALMQTMYPETPADPVTDPMPDLDVHDTAAKRDKSNAEPEGEVEEETHNPSAFQKILRRQEGAPLESQPKPEPADEIAPPPVAPIHVPAPAAGRARRQAGRVKTRLLGFGNDFGGEKDLFAADGAPIQPTQAKFPVGWMVIVSGPGRGTAFSLFNGVSQIGRGEDQAVRLDFGDNSISRANHAAVAYDPEQQGFFLGHGGKANLVRLNGSPVLSTEPLLNGALIRIGETTLRFVGLCGDDFSWGDTQDGEGDNARFD